MRPHVVACVDASSTTEALWRSGRVHQVVQEIAQDLAIFASLAVQIEFELLSELVRQLVKKESVFVPRTNSPKIVLIATNGHTEDVTSRVLIEQGLQRLPHDVYVLFATLPEQHPASKEWMRFLETKHPNAHQIGVVWFHRNETALDTLRRVMQPWLQSLT